MTRDEHMAWCKKRALEYLDRGDIQNAVTSMLSDLRKHPETAKSGDGIFAAMGITVMINGNTAEARRFITGFN